MLDIDRKKDSGISWLRIIATVCVVWIHTCSTLDTNPQIFKLSENQLHFYSLGHQCMAWAVPSFFMITGALLLNKEKTITCKQAINKYCRRILGALVIFGVPFAIVKEIGGGITDRYIIFKAIEDVLTNNSLSHLWYLYDLIGIYLVTSFIKKIINLSTKKEIEILLFILFIFDFVVPTISDYIAFNIPFGYTVFYYIAGYYFYYLAKHSNLIRYYLGILVACFVLLILMNNLSIEVASKLSTYFSPLTACMAICCFQIITSIKTSYSRTLWSIDRVCFGVYLIHPLFIQLCYRKLSIVPFKYSFYPLMTIFFWFCFSVVSFIFAKILYSIPFLKKYIL